MQKKIILLFIAFSLSIYNCFAQSSPAFGSTNGVADVSQTGAATYQIPIHTPPGTNGFQPSISISYNSQAGNGVLGYGWNISGLSAISRVPKTIYHNGIAEGITLTRKDNLALDGNRLIAINNDSTEFRTEAETYSKINGGKSKESYYWFEAKTKEGGTLQYGITEDSRLRPGGKWSQPVAWYINQSKDPNGNTINYSYSSQGGQMCLDKIEYAGNTIQFQYEDRPDKSTTYIAGASVIQSKRLTKVIVKSDGLLARTYVFAYTHDGLYSHLSSVTEYGSNNVPLNPTRFIMGSRNEETIATLSQIAKGYYKQIYTADLTGDGRSDIIVTYKSKVDGDWTNWEFHTANADGKTFTKRNGGTLTSSFKGFHVADINHDGVADVYMRTTGKETYCCITCDQTPPNYSIKDNDTLASRELFLEEKDLTALPPEEPNDGCCGTCSYDRQTLVAYTHQNGSLVRMKSKDTYFDHVNGDAIIYAGMNFDGDGKPDFLVLNKDYSYKTARITSSHFWMPSFPAKPNNVDLLDFNGDGRTDFMVTKDDSSFIYSFNPEKHTFEILYSSGFPTKWHSTHFGDFNGDGKTDILTYTDESSWNLAFSTGTSFSWPLITDLPFYKANPDKNELMSLFIGDFNGDGRDDILQTLAYNRDATANYNYFYISDGMGKFNLMASGEFNFKQKIAFIAKEKTIFSWYRKWASYNGHALADFNGDGKIDVLPYHGKPNAEQGVITPFANNKSNQLIAIVDGMGRETRFTYLPLTAGVSIYQKGSGATFPLIDIVAPITVVSSISQPDGIGGKTTTSYKYNGAKVLLQGKGFLGFTEVISSNNSTGLSSSLQNEFNTTFFVALPYKTTTYISGTKLSETTITNRLQDLGNKRYAHFTDKVILFKNPEGTLFTTLYTYDTYGNATNIKEVHPLRVVETTNTYARFGGWGPSNKLDSTKVKSTYSGKSTFTRSTTYGYDTKGNLIKETTDNGITTTYTLNPAGVVTQITTTASGEATNTTKIDYDSQSRYVVKTTDALNQVTSRVVDPRTGNIREEIAINGLKTTYEYDGFGRLLYTKTPEGNFIRVNRNGNPTNEPQHCAYSIETIPDGRPKTVSYFDILGRELRSEVTGLSGVIVTDKAYNTKGQITTLTLPHYTGTTAKTTTYTYDIYGRVTTENTNGKTTTSTYSNKESNTTVATTTPAGQKYTKIYNALGNLISASDNGGSINYSYHSSGQVERINADGLITQFTYDSFGRQLSLTDPSAGKTEYTYTPTGKIKTQKDARGNLYTFNYDALGRITTCTGPQENLTYAYATTGGGKGQIASITNSHNKTKKEYQYDSYGRITKFTDKVGEVTFTSEYQYDSNGNITKQTYPSGYAITNSYTNGYLTKVEGSNGDKIWEFGSETALGQPISYKLGNNVTVTHSYNQDMHLTGIKTGTALDYSYSFNATTGNLSWRKDNKANLQENFTYDNLNRLEKVSMGSHQQLIRYEKNGNISYKDDAGMYTYTGYKVTGINSSSNNIPSATQETAFNGFGKIDSIAEGAASIRFVYGTDRQRIKSVEKQGTTTTTRYYTASHEREVTATGTTDRSYIYSPYGLAAVVEKKGDTYTTLLVSTDHLGSIVGLFTPNGNLVQKLSYDAWGNLRNPADYSQPFADTPRLRRGFTGHEHEPLFGIINMNGRLYDPVLGRFLSPDPYVQMPDFTQNFNRYSYCLNNPLVYTDPSGESFISRLASFSYFGFFGLWQHNIAQKKGYTDFNSFLYAGAQSVITAASLITGNYIATSQIMFANTAAIVAGSTIYSGGNWLLSGGETDFTVNMGFASYNFSTNDWGYLGKKGNSLLENIGYGLGTLANVSDFLAGFNPSEVQLNTEKSDIIGHSSLTKVGETNPHNSLVSVGPDPGGKWILNPLEFKTGTNNWKNYVNAGRDVWKVGIKGVNLDRIASYGANLNKGVKYNLYFSSCVNHTARALTLAGAPAIGIHPFILHSQMVLRSMGLRPTLYSYYLNQ